MKTSRTKRTLKELDVLIRARYPILYIITHEEARVERLINDLVLKQNKPVFSWTCTRGLRQKNQSQKHTKSEYADPLEVLDRIGEIEGSGVFLLRDFHPYLDDPFVERRLRDLIEDIKSTYKTVMIVSPHLTLPESLEKDISIVDFPLPDLDELAQLLSSLCQKVQKDLHFEVNLKKSEFWSLAKSALGLTHNEATNVFSKAVVNDSVLDIEDMALIAHEKRQIIRKSGILDFFNSETKIDEIGGLANLKHWLELRQLAIGDHAKEFGLALPKGVLLLGAPGCGKSLTAKAIANLWGLPLIRLDFGRIFSGLVGSSEENMRNALKVAESVSPAVLWIDELEKGLSGNTSGNSDGGTATRVFGTFLTWMQEKSSFVFVVATANNIDLLPPELLRKGRFDEIFFVELPNDDIRRDIFAIHLRKRGRDPNQYDLSQLTEATHDYSGAEIEHCVTEALFYAYSESRDLQNEDILRAILATQPLSVTYAESLEKLRTWASARARSADRDESGLVQNHDKKTV